MSSRERGKPRHSPLQDSPGQKTSPSSSMSLRKWEVVPPGPGTGPGMAGTELGQRDHLPWTCWPLLFATLDLPQ